MAQEIQQIHPASRGTYGSPRIHASFVAKGFRVGRQRVVRLMAHLGIWACPKRQFNGMRDSGLDLVIAENVLGRNVSTTAPDRGWGADITSRPTAEGWLDLAVSIDLFSRRVVGWSMAEHLPTALVLTALNSALGPRNASPTGLVFASDRGSQYPQ